MASHRRGPHHKKEGIMTHSTPSTALVLGREPAAITTAVMAAVALVSGFIVPVDAEAQSYIQAAVGALLALYVAVKVRENVVPVILALLAAVIPLAVHYGLDWNAEQQALVFTAVSVLLGLVAGRPNLTPKVNVIDARQTGPSTFDATQ